MTQDDINRVARSCADCRHFAAHPAELERALPGFNILSSAYGSVRGETGLCRQRETFVTPLGSCTEFVARAGFASSVD